MCSLPRIITARSLLISGAYSQEETSMVASYKRQFREMKIDRDKIYNPLIAGKTSWSTWQSGGQCFSSKYFLYAIVWLIFLSETCFHLHFEIQNWRKINIICCLKITEPSKNISPRYCGSFFYLKFVFHHTWRSKIAGEYSLLEITYISDRNADA